MNTTTELDNLRYIVHRFDMIILSALRATKNPELTQIAQTVLSDAMQIRNKLIHKISSLKTKLDIPIYDPKLEKKKLEDLKAMGDVHKGELSPEEIEKYFKTIFAQARQIQEAKRNQSAP